MLLLHNFYIMTSENTFLSLLTESETKGEEMSQDIKDELQLEIIESEQTDLFRKWNPKNVTVEIKTSVDLMA